MDNVEKDRITAQECREAVRRFIDCNARAPDEAMHELFKRVYEGEVLDPLPETWDQRAARIERETRERMEIEALEKVIGFAERSHAYASVWIEDARRGLERLKAI